MSNNDLCQKLRARQIYAVASTLNHAVVGIGYQDAQLGCAGRAVVDSEQGKGARVTLVRAGGIELPWPAAWRAGLIEGCLLYTSRTLDHVVYGIHAPILASPLRHSHQKVQIIVLGQHE